MEVTSENFDEIVQEIEILIPQCSFVSIDCEFTGLEKG
jgi:hypothetical protein